MTSLPEKPLVDSAFATRVFFEKYGNGETGFTSNEVSASIGFFQSKGFAIEAAIPTAMVLLTKAKEDGQPVFEILDTLLGSSDIQISTIVARVLNENRPNSSKLGVSVQQVIPKNVARNILP